MSELFTERSEGTKTNILNFPFRGPTQPILVPESKTPQADKIIIEAQKLDGLYAYKSSFDYEIYRQLEARYADKPIRGGVSLKTAFRLVNSHSTCQQCLYAFEVDTYGRGCIHDCAYCYARAELVVHGYWNNPIPVPVDINEIRKNFGTVFETTKKNKWREILEKKIPLRIGSMSDSFMWMDQKYKVTQELLRILKYYNYPYVVFTRSDLIAQDEYLKLLDPDLAAIQFSISSTNEDLVRKVEPGAPSSKRRLKALQTLSESGFWTAVRINPFFPMYPDGYFTDPNFTWQGQVPKFDYSSFEMVDEIAAHKVPAVLAGFVRLSRVSLNALERATGHNLRQFYNRNLVNKSARDFHFSDREIRHYYEEIKKRCITNNIQFTTCYIGNGEGHFWKDQDLWSNKRDCCNIKSKVRNFQTDARQISFESRLKFTSHKDSKPTSENLQTELGTLKALQTQSPPLKAGKETLDLG